MYDHLLSFALFSTSPRSFSVLIIYFEDEYKFVGEGEGSPLPPAPLPGPLGQDFLHGAGTGLPSGQCPVTVVMPGITLPENATNETTLTDGPQCFLPLQLAMDWVRIRITLALSDSTFQV